MKNKEIIMNAVKEYTASNKCDPRDRVLLPMIFGIMDALIDISGNLEAMRLKMNIK